MAGLAVLLASLLACDATQGDAVNTVQSGTLVIAPVSPLLAPGEGLKFTAANVSPADSLTWSVLEAGGGSIDELGNYVAPDAEGIFTVHAMSPAGGAADAKVSVRRGVQVAISPSTATVSTGGSINFTAGVSGWDKRVTWSVREGSAGGTITSAGVYTAPATAGTYHVVATSAAAPAASATAAVTVTAPAPPASPPAVTVSVSPQTASLSAGSTEQFTAAVSNAADASVTWSVVEQGGGTVSSSGLYTAPATAGTYHVVVTSAAAPAASATAAVTVTAPVPLPIPAVTVSVSPQTASLNAGSTGQFTAAVSNAADASVTWSVAEQGGGTVSTSGLYTAPAAAGTYHVVATSNADRTVSATAAVTITVTAPPAPTGVGTGYTHTPQFITSVTGGGAMPDTNGAPVARCAGNGTTDDTSCLQNAINAAAAAHRPLLIPATSSNYRISNRLVVTTSLIGINGRPTLHTANTSTNQLGDVLLLPKAFSGWIYNLHLLGNFNGTGDAAGEWAHTIELGCVSNVTIAGNLLENPIGDAVGTDYCAGEGGVATNVLVANNTMLNPFRCAVAFTWYAQNWVVRDNLIDKQSDFVSGIDFEPEANGTVSNVEVLYNQFAMYNPVPYYATEGSDGKAVSGWQVSSNPGGNYYLHHNYGHYGTGFGGEFGGSNWGYVYQASNAAGPMLQ